MDKRFMYVIIGVHRTLREVVGWAGKEGFLPLTRQAGAEPRLKEITGDVAEELMKQITKRATTTKYEFAMVPVIPATTPGGQARSEAGLILPHLH